VCKPSKLNRIFACQLGLGKLDRQSAVDNIMALNLSVFIASVKVDCKV